MTADELEAYHDRIQKGIEGYYSIVRPVFQHNSPHFLMPVIFLIVGGGTERMNEEMTTHITVALTADSYSPAAQNFLKKSLETQGEGYHNR